MGKSTLYETKHKINDFITIRVPTIKDIIENEDDYYGNVALIVATPYDMMVQLDDMKIDFTQINEWDLFLLLFNELRTRDLSLIFDGLNLRDFVTAENKQNGNIILVNPKTGVKIDRAIHDQICRYLRKTLRLQKNDKRPANEEARKFLIERTRTKLKRRRKQLVESQIEKYIVALVNTSEFPYTYESVLGLTINQFYASLHQIVKKIKYDKLMIGCYAGTVNMKELDQNELNWISN
ncbi:MAG: hypothetical protein IKB90_01655 [Alistipes sp.]|nr:hypothetical protein [Clostridia bacterium]MBR2032934.1 hypothetical protein [Alistipes sp.]MBR2858786.1 hypothetical protein [Alistipes sp.]